MWMASNQKTSEQEEKIMSILMSNKLALSNPISDELQRDFLSDCCRILYYLKVTDGNMTITTRYTNWDDLVESIKLVAKSFESELSGFKIWTEMEDFSSMFDESDPDVDEDEE